MKLIKVLIMAQIRNFGFMPLFKELLDKSFLPSELKHQYFQSYNYRRKILNF